MTPPRLIQCLILVLENSWQGTLLARPCTLSGTESPSDWEMSSQDGIAHVDSCMFCTGCSTRPECAHVAFAF
eukprot:9665606-Prorocentrum_lima.AAC.1